MKLYDIFVILKLLCISLCKACKPAEYKIDNECCPMCAAGTHVAKHCDRELGTNCIPCIGSTYTNVPNGLSSCFTCTVCDEGHGLKVKKKCESVSDAVCEPLPRYYCIDINNGSCRKAREHSTCLPGQYINQTGTASKDTVCSDCPEETYSDGSFTHCKLHTTCGSLWQKTITQGTRSSDAVCGHNPLYLGLILGILLLVILLIAILSVLLWNRKKISCCRNQSDNS